MELGKVPPHDEDAEQAVLGSMLTDNDAVMAAVEVLKEDAFYRDCLLYTSDAADE